MVANFGAVGRKFGDSFGLLTNEKRLFLWVCLVSLSRIQNSHLDSMN